jgi:hypothetical protein
VAASGATAPLLPNARVTFALCKVTALAPAAPGRLSIALPSVVAKVLAPAACSPRGRALVLSPYQSEFGPQAGGDEAAAIAASLAAAGYSVTMKCDAAAGCAGGATALSDFKGWGDYAAVALVTHGDAGDAGAVGAGAAAVVLTGLRYSDVAGAVMPDWVAGRAEVTGDGFVALLPQWFEFHANQMAGAVVYFSACRCVRGRRRALRRSQLFVFGREWTGTGPVPGQACDRPCACQAGQSVIALVTAAAFDQCLSADHSPNAGHRSARPSFRGPSSTWALLCLRVREWGGGRQRRVRESQVGADVMGCTARHIQPAPFCLPLPPNQAIQTTSPTTFQTPTALKCSPTWLPAAPPAPSPGWARLKATATPQHSQRTMHQAGRRRRSWHGEGGAAEPGRGGQG